MAENDTPKAKTAAKPRAPRPRAPAAASAEPSVRSSHAARTLSRNELEKLRARLQKKFH